MNSHYDPPRRERRLAPASRERRTSLESSGLRHFMSDMEGASMASARSVRGLAFWCAIVAMLSLGFVAGSVGQANAIASRQISGTVRCLGGGKVVGVWVESSAGSSGWANFKLIDGFEYPNKSLAYYWHTLTISGSSNVSLHIGCGGDSTSWGSDNWTPTFIVNASRPWNTTCSEAPGPGAIRCSTPVIPSIGNRVADLALTYRTQHGDVACDSAGKADVNGDQCREFANCLVYRASHGDYYSSGGLGNYSYAGATKVSAASARRGDIIQKGQGIHTAIVLKNLGGGSYNVVDSNFYLNGIVHVHTWTPSGTYDVWRFGQESSDTKGAP